MKSPGKLDADKTYGDIVRFYVDKKGYAPERANVIAQSVVRREAEKQPCKRKGCGHKKSNHAGACAVPECGCIKFL